MADFMPKKDTDLVNWLTNFKTKISGYAATFTLSAEKVAQLIAYCDAVIAQIQAVEQAKSALASKITQKETVKKTNLGALRGELNILKASPAMTDTISTDLQVVGTADDFNPETYKPVITGQPFSGFNRLKFTKKGVDGLKFYSRLKGQTAWKFLALDTNSPYDDYNPPATPGVAEVREYQAFGVIDDEQIGQPSDIVSVTFGG